jgi:hypothetical protein
MQLEDLGFCAKGEGPAFVRKQRLYPRTAASRSTPAAASSRSARPARPAASSAWSRRSASSGEAGARAVKGCETRAGQRVWHDQLRPWPRFRSSDPCSSVLSGRIPSCALACRRFRRAARSRIALGLTAAAAMGRFELQQCKDCGAVQYPPREACQVCLSTKLAGKTCRMAETSLHARSCTTVTICSSASACPGISGW